ncbi:MAG: hypothetical protein GWP05_03955 [Anaerolineaceae bacterium]|nr:hypothetical protein [Anaerolineaceae bacterium]
MKRLTLPIPLLATAVLLAGCFGYTTEPLHRTSVRTVAVPIFQSDEFRRGLEMEFTKELIRMIELRTPYKVTSEERADTVITGKIVDLREGVLTEDDRDNASVIQTSLYVDYRWKDLRTGRILRSGRPHQAYPYAPVEGQTLRSSTTFAIRKLAEKIVEDMEEDW